MFRQFETAPTLTPDAALLVGAGVIVGGILIFAAVVVLTRYFARRGQQRGLPNRPAKS